ncbi:hypothetical protein C5167_010951 [Papaver somniferum]|uniref:RRM domain-containing protein n=1 Tax=Papaver somniferum TaxID=3469 RepID=A0A4Y7K4I4_PAPSO|nr:polyadenylate-binding protein RBP47-like [Papaver somniferum]RZC67260.1 hypothetical protein C5167_010951 [Papaver somniferum]
MMQQQVTNSSDPQQQQQQQQPQQWIHPMQYPGGAAAMVMPHHPHQMIPQHYPPHFMGFPHQQQHQQQQHIEGSSSEENKTIWVGDLHYWMDESYLQACFGHTGEVLNIKVIRNKQTSMSEGYGFVEFATRAMAEKVLQEFNGISMLNAEQPFRLNWASFSMGDKRSDAGSDKSIFVGDLASDVTDTVLQETFASRYTSVKGAKVVIDANTGRSKGYGFVRFGDDSEMSRAMTEMNGVYCSSRAMRIGPATPRKSAAYQQQQSSQGGYASNGASAHDGDSTNTTIFVGGLDSTITDDDLKQTFSQYGEITSVKIPLGKGCGFVQFANRNNAEEALAKLQGTTIGKQTVRLSWGRNPANKQRADPSGQWGAPAYGAYPVYDYGYGGPVAQDPMYAAAAYGAYPVYGNQQQVS